MTRTGLGHVRMILYAHLLAIVLCAVMTLADTGQIRLPPAVRMLLFPVGLLALVFPLVIGKLAIQLTDRSLRFRWGIVLLDVWLSIIQLWTMLPLVQ